MRYQELFLCAGFTGIDQEYEQPLKPELVLRAGQLSLDECVQDLLSYLQHKVTYRSPTNVPGRRSPPVKYSFQL